jgi:tetratricopeptide (TPR) repeat protein
MNIEELRDRLQEGGEIDWTTFEDVVFEAAKATLFGPDSGRIELERHKKGPIDIVITVRRSPLSVGRRALAGLATQTAYIECKHYNRQLEFADAAKVFCVALKEPPNELVIVSSRDMSPQAWEYARHFFTVDSNRGVFGNVHFDHWSLAEVLGSAPAVAVPEERPDTPARSWVLRASDAFTNKVVARSESLDTVVLDRRSTYTLEITPGACTHTFVVSSVTDFGVELSLSGACTTSRRKASRRTLCTLSPDTLALLPERAALTLSVACRTSGQFTVSAGDVMLQGGGALIDDLRAEMTASWVARLVDPSGPNVLVVAGEGGIGKTHFCVSVCNALHQSRGYRCMTITVTPETGDSVFFRVLWSLVVPDFGESTEPPDRDLLAVLLSRLLADDRRADAEIMARMLVEGDLRKVDVEVITFLCARLLSQNPVPRALLISNAHHLAPHVLRAFELLFSALADQGWSSTRVFLEYRTGEESPRLREVLDRLRSDSQHVAFLDLHPLEQRELATALVSRVPEEQRRDLAGAIYRKAGGNALFVMNVILWAVGEGFIVRRGGRLTVHDWPGLERELEKLPPQLDQFLDRRIKGVLARAALHGVLPYLIAAAFAGFEIDEEQVRRTTALSSAECDAARLHLCTQGIITESLAGPVTTFSHEIMLLSARSAVSMHAEFGNIAAGIAESLDRDIFEDTLMGGRLSTALHQRRAAFAFYNRGYELARNASAFHRQCIALDGAHRVLASTHTEGDELTRNLVEITLALAEAELLGGSMVRADRALRHVLDLAAREERVWPSPDEVRWWRCRALGYRIQLFVRLMKPSDALQSFAELLVTFKAPPGMPATLRAPMTRILLTLAMASRPADARMVAEALLSAWDEMPPDEQSSLCSDIGRIYLQADLETAAEWWHRGAALAKERRQHAHSLLNVFVVDLLRGAAVAPNRTDELRKNAASLGVHNQVARIDLAAAVLAQQAGDDEHAGHLTNLALRLSRSTSQVFWEWKALNNLGVLAMKEERLDDATRLFETALALTSDLRNFADSGPLAPDALLPRSALGAGPSDTLAPAPQRSGMWHVLVHNLDATRFQKAPALDRELAALADGPLRVQTRVGDLYFALE